MAIFLSDEELDILLFEAEEFVASNDDIYSFEIDYGGQDRDASVILRVSREVEPPDIKNWTVTTNKRSVVLEVKSVPSDPIRLAIGRPDDLRNALAKDLDTAYAGMGGTIIYKPDGSWGTLSFSVRGIEVKIVKGGRVLQQCKRLDAPTLVSNSHVIAPNGTSFSYDDTSLGTTTCHFDLNMRETADYAHASWDNQFNSANYLKVYDENDNAGKAIKNLTRIGIGYGVGKQGGRTNWTTGYVRAKTVISIRGYNGTFRCWRAEYGNDLGDSGSPVLYRIGAEWYLAGIHFATNGHFWSWDDIQQLKEIGVTDGISILH